jgi:hypothetical protein
VPKALLEAFPLNPTGERIDARRPEGPAVFRPPVRGAAGGTGLVFVAAIGGAGLLAVSLVLVLAFFLHALLRPPGSTTEPAAYVSAVFVGARRLPVIEGAVRRRRGAPVRSALRLLLAVALVAGLAAFLFLVQQVA